jgi:hypothetical protein
MRLGGPKSAPTPYTPGTCAVAGAPGDQRRRRIDPDLEIDEAIWSDEVVRRLLDDWLIPAIVDRILGDLVNSAGDEVR